MGKLRLWRLTAMVCAWVIVAGGAGCSGTVSKPGPVLLMGDSIFFLANNDLTYVLRTDGWTMANDSYPGAGISGGGFSDLSWPPRMRDLVAYIKPQAVVVELGTNGCSGCASLPAAIDADMETLKDVKAVMWLKVGTEGPRADVGKEVNAALEEATERWGNLTLLPYDEWVAGRPDLVPPNDVHPTAAGQAALARHVGDALDDRAADAGKTRAQALGAAGLVVLVAIVFMRKK
jgi:GDSL-like Lipase/Acylhydrolase family